MVKACPVAPRVRIQTSDLLAGLRPNALMRAWAAVLSPRNRRYMLMYFLTSRKRGENSKPFPLVFGAHCITACLVGSAWSLWGP